MSMKKPKRRLLSAKAKSAAMPAGTKEAPAGAAALFSRASQDEMARNAEIGIRTLPVWKEYVRKYGLAEARNILRRGLLVRRITESNPLN